MFSQPQFLGFCAFLSLIWKKLGLDNNLNRVTSNEQTDPNRNRMVSVEIFVYNTFVYITYWRLNPLPYCLS